MDPPFVDLPLEVFLDLEPPFVDLPLEAFFDLVEDLPFEAFLDLEPLPLEELLDFDRLPDPLLFEAFLELEVFVCPPPPLDLDPPFFIDILS